MSDDKKSELDRMSLDSLKRELEVQKARSEQMRSEAKDRMEAETQKAKAFPWGMLAAILGGGVLVFFGIVYALRASFPGVAEYALPDWVYTPFDGGPAPVHPDAGVPVVEAEPDAGPPAVHHGTGGHHGTGHGGSSSSGGHIDLSGLGGGGTDDPVGGL